MFNSIRNNKSLKYYMTILVLVLVSGQLLAEISECDMQSSKSNNLSTHMMDSSDPHAGHDMSQMSEMSDHSEMSDCCMDDCQCAQSACSTSLTMISNKTGFKLFSDAKALVQKSNSSYISQASSALFRPPIFC